LPYNTCRFRNNMTLKIPSIFLVNLWKYTKITFHHSIEHACTEKRLRAEHIADARMRSRDLIQVHRATDADKIGTSAGTAYTACNREYDQRNIDCTDRTSKQNPDLKYSISRSPKIKNTRAYRYFNEERVTAWALPSTKLLSLTNYGRPFGRPVIRQTIIFSCCGYFFLLFSRLISAVGDWMSTILPHMVWP